MKLQGSLVALITPMREDSSIDWPALEKLLHWHVQQGTHGIVSVGTTGESATLTVSEHLQVIERTIEIIAGRLPVIAGTGANATAEAIHLTRQALTAGADASLLVTPYYNRPTQEGLYRHFMAIADACDLPQILYNVPPRTGCDMLAATVGRLAGHDNIIGLKEACGDPERVSEIRDQVPDDFAVLSGEDAQTLRMMELGAVGTISVTANVVPSLMAQFCQAFLDDDRASATELDARLQPIHEILFVESSPQPTKWALHEMGMVESGIRLPLLALSEAHRPELKARLQAVGALVLKQSWLIVLIGLTSGCGWWNDDKGVFVNREDDYIDVQERRDLIIPNDLDATGVQDPLPIPPANTVLNAEFFPEEPPRPDAIFANDNRDEVRIQRLGARRWLVVPEPATTVWPKVRQFFAENGVAIEWEDSRYGRIDTQWMQIGDESYRDVVRNVISDMKSDVGMRGGEDRVLLRVEQGLRERNSEIHLRYQNTEVSAVDEARVRDLNTVPTVADEIETELLNEMGAYIASKVSEQSISRVAQVISAGVKSEVTRNSSSEPVLALRLDYDRAWATIAQALNRAEVEVLDLDQQAGTYHVLIPDSVFTGQPGGWFSGLFGSGQAYDLLLRFTRAGENRYYVSVMDTEQQPVERALSQEVLTMIREFSS